MSSQNVSKLVKGLRLAIEVIGGLNEFISFFEKAKSIYLRSQRNESHGQDLQDDVSYLQNGGSGSREQDLPDDVSHLQSGQGGPQEQDLPDDVLHVQRSQSGSQEQDLPDDVLHVQRSQSGSQEQDHQDGALLHVRSGYSGSHEQDRQDDVLLRLQRGIRELRDTLPVMYNLIDQAEWRSHDNCVADLLPTLKDAVHNADDLLDEFRWYEMKAELEGNSRKSPFTGFIDTHIRDSFEKLKGVRGRLEDLSRELKRMGLYKVIRRFDKSVRPETKATPSEEKIFGRDKELKEVMGFLRVPTNVKRKRGEIPVNASTSTSSSNQVSVLPIVGIGGVEKTTLGQHICNQRQVKCHFDLRIWICVSDDFDEKRLFKEVIQSCPKKEVTTNDGEEASTNNLDSLDRALSKHVKNKRFFIVLDDIWGDALKDNGQCWDTFCSPFRSAKDGSMILVTTRCPKVAEGVGTMKPVMIEGLKDDVFWNFFKLCVFGSENSSNDPELEHIGRSILPKLKGSPLAAKTLGRMLKMDLEASHWNSILESDLWELRQESTDILPALRLSYMYLPFYLKKCFSFCAVYPKDYKFEKEQLAEIWAAEGFVEPQGDNSLTKIGCQYFQDLVVRSFFQVGNGGRYVIHDLLHDMAQKVSEYDCFILKNKNDYDKVPEKVRHVYILPNKNIGNSDLLRLCKHSKLHTIICEKQLGNRTSSVIDKWCSNLLCLRVISLASTNEFIGNLKHLRYLKISADCPLNIPSTIHRLYNLQILDVSRCNIKSLPNDFSNLKSLLRFRSQGFLYYPGCRIHLDVSPEEVQGLGLIKNLNQFRGSLEISNVGMLSKDHAAEAEMSKKYLYDLELHCWSIWSTSQKPQELQSMQHNAIEVFELLQPSTSLRTLRVTRYPGLTPSWFQAQNLPILTSLTLENCDGLVSISCSMVSQNINLNEIPAVLDDNNSCIFTSLTEVSIVACQNLSSLDHFLQPDYVPAIKKIGLINCERLVSVPVERCKRLELGDCGNLFGNIECCSLTEFTISSYSSISIQRPMWSFPDLQKLTFSQCTYLTSIGVSTNLPLCEGSGSMRAFSRLNSLNIRDCPELSMIEFDGLLTQENPPTIERINIVQCSKLMSLPGGWFGSFPCLKQLQVNGCPLLSWQRGLVLPSSLQNLELQSCGDFSASVPGCLENLTSLVSLKIYGCQGLTSIPGSIWQSKLALLEKLEFWGCPNLVSIGGAKAVENIKNVDIIWCPKLEEEWLMTRRRRRY